MFHKHSKKENMLYSLHAGSLAGFYWNGKVMPFDDDIDIIVSRDSFK
jgi:phosphorylcholine metabolism protein LicD